MDFINLEEVLKSIAECDRNLDYAKHDLYSKESFQEAESYSKAAAELHRELHNNETHPRWVTVSDTTKQPLFDDTISKEGMDLLKHMAGWHERLKAGYLRYLDELKSAEKAGIDISQLPPSIRLDKGKYTRKGYFQALQIGFDRKDLIAFMNANNITHSLTIPNLVVNADVDTDGNTDVDADGNADVDADGNADAIQSKTNNMRSWNLIKLQRTDTLSQMIYKILKKAYEANEPNAPRAREVMERIAEDGNNMPDFMELTGDSIKYSDTNGNIKATTIQAVRKRLNRMIDKQQ